MNGAGLVFIEDCVGVLTKLESSPERAGEESDDDPPDNQILVHESPPWRLT
jgi:hypothetical protein